MTIKVKQTTWNLKLLFKSDDDPAMEKKRKTVEEENYKFINKWKNREDYLESPAVLKEAMDEYERLRRYYGTGGDEDVYFWLRMEQDKNNAKLKAKTNKIQDFSNRILNDIQFFALKIARIPAKDQKKFLEFEGLKDYRHFLEKLFAESKHLLSEPEEKIMNLKATPAYANWVNMTSGFISREERKIISQSGKKTKKNFSEILALATDKNKKIRNSAAEALNDIFKKNADVAEAEMNSIMADKKINDELRGFYRPDSSMHVSDDISDRVADILVGALAARYDISREYYRLKAKLFGVKKLKYHERNVEYGHLDKKYSYQEAVNFVFKIFGKIDKGYADIFESFVENGQIDVCPKKGKSPGAFCFHYLLSQPTYILINYTNRLKDVFTLAHEAGHGVNNELMRKKQNSLNFGGPLFTAEVSSKLAEEFVFQEMLKTKDDELRLAMMMAKLNDEILHIFMSAAENNFERELHQTFRQKGYLSKKEIGGLFKKHIASYMGSSVEQFSGSENWWMHVSHFRVFFYNYQYAAGILIAKALGSMVKEDPKFINKVKEFLSAGSSESPEDIFKRLGVDITSEKFWNRGIGEVEKLLNETEKLVKKLNKI